MVSLGCIIAQNIVDRSQQTQDMRHQDSYDYQARRDKVTFDMQEYSCVAAMTRLYMSQHEDENMRTYGCNG